MADYVSTGKSLHVTKYRPDIDGLRAIAVSSVVLCHAFPSVLPGGFIGVDIFFVISGYLISSILIKELDEDSYSIFRFYNRRILRIFPALIVVLLFVGLFGWFCLFRPEFFILGRHICASALFSENFLLWSQASYFDVSSALKPTLHLWSLAIEEQFYIFWPMLMYLAHRQKVNFAVMFAILAGASFVINLHDIYTNPAAAYYSPLGRSWELMVGSFLAWITIRHPDFIARYSNARSFAGLLLIVLALIFVGPDDGFPGFWALLPTLGAALLISSGATGWVNRRVLSTAPLVWCGLISYSLYLWHWPLLSFATIIWRPPISNLKAAVCVLAAIIAATFTFFLIERPFRRRGLPAGNTFGLAGTMVGMLACGALVATQIIPPRLKQFNAAPTRTEWSFLEQKTGDSFIDATGFYPLAPKRKELVLFIGDSHVAQYAERINKQILSDPTGPGVVMAIGGGCIPIENARTNNIRRASCWPMITRAFALAEQSRFQTVVIGGAWSEYFLSKEYYTYDANGKRVTLGSTEGRQIALQTLAQRIQLLIHSGKHVIFVLDNPISPLLDPGGEGIRLSLFAKNFRPNMMVNVGSNQATLEQQLYSWAKNTGASVIDPFDAVCAGSICRVTTQSGQPLYRDQGHFNPDWTINHADFIDATLRS